MIGDGDKIHVPEHGGFPDGCRCGVTFRASKPLHQPERGTIGCPRVAMEVDFGVEWFSHGFLPQ